MTLMKSQRLLSADEIRSIRERFGLTQAELARLLRPEPGLTVCVQQAGRCSGIHEAV